MPFPATYSESRGRFLAVTESLADQRWQVECPYRGPDDEPLVIDVARMGSRSANSLLIVSTGLHGVEAPVGLPLLERVADDWSQGGDDNVAVLLLHALNPYGFAWSRRQDQDGIDLNRNFLLPGQPFAGVAESYQRLNAILNPASPPRWDGFYLRALGCVARYGLADLKQAVAEGQYEFPQGLFFGGAQPSWTQEVLSQQWESWIGTPRQILHLDVHSGLGPWARLQLLTTARIDETQRSVLRNSFPHQARSFVSDQPAHYHVRGELGNWCQLHSAPASYQYLCAEFGTYGPLKTLSALRRETQNWEWGTRSSRLHSKQAKALREIFCPTDLKWRALVLEQTRQVLDGAWRYLGQSAPSQ